tara:strand:+ start:1568 stop:2596 length:1029 start_codon:yes stop_codon:yes gene_type:complete
MSNQSVDRETFLQQLESVQAGLSTREVMEQSSCFVFKNGTVQTYNDEIACKQNCTLDLHGAVQAEPLLGILRKLPENSIQVTNTDEEFIIEGKKRKAGIRMEHEILLPVERIDQPVEWKDLPDDFTEAVQIVCQCAGADESQFRLTCVHITPTHVEASDNFQVSRYTVATPIEESTLVRRDSIKHIIELGMTQFCETESWIHFKNPNSLILSCRRYADEANDFPDLSPIIDFNGEPTTLPTSLAEAVEKAEIFSSESTDDNQVLIQLRAGKLRIRGEGNFGWFTETKPLKYKGKDLSFRISPKLLVDLVNRHNECEITEDRLKVDGGNFVYVTSLSIGETIE